MRNSAGSAVRAIAAPGARHPRREPMHTPANDLFGRVFTAPAPNLLWVADITYVPTTAGFMFLAVVLDAWSRRIVGWAMANDLRTQIVLDALDMAVSIRKPADVVYHSDQGSQLSFNWSSQHLSALIVAPHQELRPAFSSRASCAASR